MTDSFTPKPKDPAGDPLAELARLIGQSDPFVEQPRKTVDTFRAFDRPAPAGSAPEWLARPAPAPDHEEPDYAPRPAAQADYVPRHDDYDDRAGEAEQPYAPAPSHGAGQSSRPLPNLFAAEGRHEAYDEGRQESAARYQAAPEPQDDGYDQDGYESRSYQGDDRYRVAPPPAGDYEADAYYDGHMPPQGEDGAAAGGRRRGGLLTIAAVFGLAVIGTAGAFGYRAFSNSGGPESPPVIKADTTPAKIVATPAAAPADASAKPFQERVGGVAPAGERLVSREEQPVALQTAPARAAVAPPLPQAAMAAPAPAAAAPIVPSEPKKVKVEIIRQNADGTTSASIAPARPAAAPRQQTQPTGGAGPIAITPQAEPQARTKTASRTPSAAPSGAYAVQITAQKSEAEAQSAYRAMQAKYPSVLAGRDASIRRADLGGSGVWYRAQVGAFGTFEQATAFCNNLKDAGGQCIVQKN